MRRMTQSILILALISIGLLPLSVVAVENFRPENNSEILQLTAEEQQYLQQNQHLTMCVEPDWMPYEKLEEGRHIGMVADFMRLFANKLNINIEIASNPAWLEALTQGKQRHCDIFSLVMATPERKQFLDFTQAYLSFPLVVAVNYHEDFFGGIDDVLDKKLGIQKGYDYAESLLLQYPDIHLVEVESLDEGLKKVSRNQLYGMIGSLPEISYAFQQEYIDELKIAVKLTQDSNLTIGTRNDQPLLVGIFNKVIAQLSEQEQRDIINDWISIKYVSETDYALLIKVASVMLLFFVIFMYRYWLIRKHNCRLRHLSVTDKLTNINNRMKLDKQLYEALQLAQRYQHYFCIILIDIDYFKNINDEYGHLIGDYALKTVAQILNSNIRAVDTLGRWGGDEFLIICPQQTVEGGRLMAEKLRTIIDQYPFENFAHLTCSFGVAAYATDQNVDNLLTRADEALYRAKDQGRSQVFTN